jgi:hypothetical protein
MKTRLVVLGALLVLGCDSGSQEPDGGTSSAFSGTWTVNTLATALGSPTASESFGPGSDLIISDRGPQEVALGVCPLSQSQVPGTLSDPTHLTIPGSTCPQIHFGPACVVTPVIDGGQGDVRGPLLTVTVTGSLEICDGGVQSYSAVYSGAK